MRDFYLVGKDHSIRVGDPGTELYDDEFRSITAQDIKESGGPARIIILTPDRWETVRKYRDAGANINWE